MPQISPPFTGEAPATWWYPNLRRVGTSYSSSVSVVFSLSLYSNRIWAGLPGFYSRQGQESFLFSTASRPVLWLLHNDEGVKLTTIHLLQMPRLRIVELYLHSSMRLNGMVLKFIDHKENVQCLKLLHYTILRALDDPRNSLSLCRDLTLLVRVFRNTTIATILASS
jgi:hypothetical protein